MKLKSPTINNAQPRSVLVVATMVLVMLAWFAWKYYLERTACFDSAFFSWLLFDKGLPVSVLGRYGSWIPQLLPVTLIHMGASLETILRSYSMAFIAFHALIFAVLAFGLKDKKATYALPIVLTAGFHYMFYYGISELYQGLSLTLLLWALVTKAVEAADPRELRTWVILAALLNVWVSFYHQLLVLPLFFVLVIDAIPADRKRRLRLMWIGAVLLVWYVIRIKGMAASTYEESRMPKLDDMLQFSKDLGALNSTVYFLSVWTKFKALLLLMVVASGLAVWRRAWLQLVWTAAFTTGFMVLVLIVDRDGMSPVIYENYYPVIGLVWVVLFLSIVPDTSSHLLRSSVLMLVCGLGLLQIHRGHYRISEKVAYAKRITAFQAEQGSRKSVVAYHNYPWTYALGHWPAGMESALCSSVQGPDRSGAIFVSDDVALLDTIMHRQDQFLGPSWAPTWFGLKKLDPRYFRFTMDVGYVHANTWVPEFPQNELVVTIPDGPYRLVPDRFTVIPIGLTNGSGSLMPSTRPDGVPCRMKYELRRSDGSVYQESSVFSDLETDIPPGSTYAQGLVIERPVDVGTYTVKARLEFGPDQVLWIPEFQVVADRWPL